MEKDNWNAEDEARKLAEAYPEKFMMEKDFRMLAYKLGMLIAFLLVLNIIGTSAYGIRDISVFGEDSDTLLITRHADNNIDIRHF